MKLLSNRRLAARRRHRLANPPIPSLKHKTKQRRARPSKHQHLYNTAEWKKLRLAFLYENPACALCGYPAEQVDHKVRHQGDVKKFLDVHNLQSLCGKCHSRKSVAERRGWRPEGS